MSIFFQYCVIGLGTSAVYVIAALGIVVIYRGTGTLNFSHGASALLCAQVFVSAYNKFPLIVAIILSLVTGVGLYLALAFLVMRPLAKSAPITRLLATLGAFELILQVSVTIFGSNPRTVKTFFPMGSWQVGSVQVSEVSVYLIIIAIAATVGISVFFARSRFGALTEAVAEKPEGVAALGRSPNIVAALAWGIGGVSAAGAGILVLPVTGLSPLPLALVILPAFSAALLGGLRSFYLVALGGLVLGVGQSLTVGYVSSGWSDALPFILLSIVVVLRSSAVPQRAELIERLPHVAGGIFPIRRFIGASLVLVLLGLFVTGDLGRAMDIGLIAGLIALSVVVLTGYAGQVSLAQFAFAALGGYVAAKTGISWGMPYIVSAIFGLAVSAVAGAVLALPAMRTRGVALAVVTLGLGITASDVFFGNAGITGIYGTPTGTPRLFGLDVSFAHYPQRFQVMLAIVFAAASGFVLMLRRSSFGRRLLSIRDNERAAAGLGINVVGAKAGAFAISAALAGLAGVLMVGFYPVIDYTQLTYAQSLNIVLLAVIGGVGWVSGAFTAGLIFPAAFFTFLIEKITGVSDASNGLLIFTGAGVLLTLIQNPDGIMPGYDKIWRKFKPAARKPRLLPYEVASSAPPKIERDTVLEVQDVSVTFGGVRAVDGISAAVRSGEVLGIIGPNGAGKTTLLDAISGTVNARGRFLLNGKDLTGFGTVRRARSGIARTFQGTDLFDDLTSAENIAVGADSSGRNRLRSLRPGRRPVLSSLIVDLAKELGVIDDLSERPNELSGGARRLIGLLRAVAQGHPVLMLDEPAASLDKHERAELGTLIRRLADEFRLAIVLIEHDVELVIRVSNKVLAMEFGREIYSGSPAGCQGNAAIRRAYIGADETGDQPGGMPPMKSPDKAVIQLDQAEDPVR